VATLKLLTTIALIICANTYALIGGVEGGASNRGGVEGGASTRMKYHLETSNGIYELQDKVTKIKEDITLKKWKVINKADNKCRDKYEFVSSSKVNVNLSKIKYDRFWINQKEYNEAYIEVDVYCGDRTTLSRQ